MWEIVAAEAAALWTCSWLGDMMAEPYGGSVTRGTNPTITIGSNGANPLIIRGRPAKRKPAKTVKRSPRRG